MAATISLEVHGMCIVREAAGGDLYSTVISVNPDLNPNHVTSADIVPPLTTHLVFSRTSLVSTGGKIPGIQVAGPDYPPINSTMFTMLLPPSTTITLTNPDFGMHPSWPIHSPVTVKDLNLGALPATWGIDSFKLLEGSRLRLPTGGRSGWGNPLGAYIFASNPTVVRLAADLFFWSAQYANTCKILLSDQAGQVDGFVELEGTTEVRYACYCSRGVDRFDSSRSAFDFHKCLEPICGGRAVPPQLVDQHGFHVGTGSCPPIKP